MEPVLVSVVIPARGDEAALAPLLGQLDPRGAGRGETEAIVALGGRPTSETLGLRESRPEVRWVDASPGRGLQMNAGAAVASGDWLWFVHADSRLPDGWIDVFRDLERAPDTIVGGSFALGLDSAAWQARVLERGVAWRVRWLGLPYGDQGIFVRRAVFADIGGFAPLPLMEDVDLVGRLKRRGRLRHLNIELVTSARRWEREGWWRRSAANLGILGLYWLGMSPDRLARRYYR
jgi:rSAM/selenodomain-associated transferase 2